MKFKVAGELPTILSPLVEKVLSSVYESRDLELPANFVFRREEAVKVINGIVKTGDIPKNAKPNQNISAAQNFGLWPEDHQEDRRAEAGYLRQSCLSPTCGSSSMRSLPTISPQWASLPSTRTSWVSVYRRTMASPGE